MKYFRFEVTQTVIVQIDEVKLAPLMEEFNNTISNFGTDGDALEYHARHIARLAGTGVADFEPRDFVEGYGIVEDAGIDVTIANDVFCVNIGGAG